MTCLYSLGEHLQDLEMKRDKLATGKLVESALQGKAIKRRPLLITGTKLAAALLKECDFTPPVQEDS